MISHYDLFPTLLEYLGLQAPGSDERPGKEFGRVLRGETGECREDLVVFDEYGPVRMIRTERWKYVHRFPFGLHELYDLATDPDERNNRIDDASCAAVLGELRTRLHRWFARYLDSEKDGSRQPVTGSGQMAPLGIDGDQASCFSADRIVINRTGFPQIDGGGDLDAFRTTTGNKP